VLILILSMSLWKNIFLKEIKKIYPCMWWLERKRTCIRQKTRVCFSLTEKNTRSLDRYKNADSFTAEILKKKGGGRLGNPGAQSQVRIAKIHPHSLGFICLASLTLVIFDRFARFAKFIAASQGQSLFCWEVSGIRPRRPFPRTKNVMPNKGNIAKCESEWQRKN